MLKIENAKPCDIKNIMQIEKESFAVDIQESEEVFFERIKIFPEGFLLFFEEEDSVCEKNLADLQSRCPLGYFSTELWSGIPDSQDFAVGHDIKKLHSPDGKILYISSFALSKNARGKGNGFALFLQSLKRLENLFLLEREVLLVNEKWQGAKHIYEKAGFKETMKVPGAFPDSKFGIFMEREL